MRYLVFQSYIDTLHLLVLNDNGDCIWASNNYIFRKPGKLREYVAALDRGADPRTELTGGLLHPQLEYDSWYRKESNWKIVADENGTYPSRMGIEAEREFGLRT